MRCFSFVMWCALALLVVSLVRLVTASAGEAAEAALLVPPSRVGRSALVIGARQSPNRTRCPRQSTAGMARDKVQP
jgi:hypothetical protein